MKHRDSVETFAIAFGMPVLALFIAMVVFGTPIIAILALIVIVLVFIK